MGQYKSFNENNIEHRLVKLEQNLKELKAVQQYSPSQMNYSYVSNIVSVPSYLAYNANSHYGVVASFLFTSTLPNTFPRISMQYSYNNNASCWVLYQRVEYVSKNKSRLVLQAVDTVVPLSAPHEFTINVWVNSNISGTLELEKTYVLPA